WTWDFERTKSAGSDTDIEDENSKKDNIAKFDAADTILGDLAVSDIKVVKLQTANKKLDDIKNTTTEDFTFKAPTGLEASEAFDDATTTDYNINTALDVTLEATQVD
ncbi:MAG: hypothetical protein IJ192_02050, partial [Clostridia bacterium]|nr:hypothetical protein [Clostridia bacterium]